MKQYLYFDRTGKLKEIVDDSPLRVGNHNANQLYIYVEDMYNDLGDHSTVERSSIGVTNEVLDDNVVTFDVACDYNGNEVPEGIEVFCKVTFTAGGYTEIFENYATVTNAYIDQGYLTISCSVEASGGYYYDTPVIDNNSVKIIYTRDNYQRMWIRYRKPSGTLTAETEITGFTAGAQLDFNKKRDLKYFQYFKNYPFFIATIPDSVLDSSGVLTATLRLVTDTNNDDNYTSSDTILTLGLLTFNVEQSLEENVYELEYDGYVSLSQFNYLLEQVSGKANLSETIRKISYSEVSGLIYLSEVYTLIDEEPAIIELHSNDWYLVNIHYVYSSNPSLRRYLFEIESLTTSERWLGGALSPAVFNDITIASLDTSSPYYLPYSTKDYVDSTFVEKTNTANQVYGTDSNGDQTTILYSAADAGSGAIVVRGSNGQITVPLSPLATSNATSKQYVDSNFVNLTGNQTITGQKTFSGKAIFNDANLYNGYITTNSKNYFVRVGVTTGQYVTYKLPSNYSDVGAVSLTLATENYVNSAIADFLQNEYTKVNTTTYPTLNDFLESTGEEGYIYLYPIDPSDETKGYYQYIWENDEWVSLGTTTIDLSGYVEKTQTIAGITLANNISSQALTNALVFATDSDIESIMED